MIINIEKVMSIRTSTRATCSALNTKEVIEQSDDKMGVDPSLSFRAIHPDIE